MGNVDMLQHAKTFRSSASFRPNGKSNGSRRKRVCKDSGRMVPRLPSPNLVMGHVRILKRGEEFHPSLPSQDLPSDSRCKSANDGSLDSILCNNHDKVPCSTGQLGPDPVLVPKQIQLTDLKSAYAGSGFASSPSPSSLPLPSFFKERSVSSEGIDDIATKDLRRLLHLDLV